MVDGLIGDWIAVRKQLEGPCFASVRNVLSALDSQHWPNLGALNAISDSSRIRHGHHQRLRFVPPLHGGSAMSYETQIAATGEVPTRQNMHDLFNALQWLSFPRLKSAINTEHVKRLQVGGTHEAKSRSKARDVLTMFDESGVIISSTDVSLLDLLREFQWKRLFIERRADVMAHMHFVVVGHGLMEKALRPFIGITGKAILLKMDVSTYCDTARLDQCAAAWIENASNLLTATSLSPIPLLGIPGWDARNEDANFYDNTDYFRRGRQCRRTVT
jgi:hypothetical protein